jgi:hypothetical protein
LLNIEPGIDHDCARDVSLSFPNLVRIMLDPARLREDLRELALRAADNLTSMVKEHGPGAGGALVQRQDRFVRHDDLSVSKLTRDVASDKSRTAMIAMPTTFSTSSHAR